jgi:3-isopropylmalate/(R)-2-methylmalate dehydratase small subunit
MKPLTIVRSTAVSLTERNVDTDIIYPARFLTDTRKTGLGEYAFKDRRNADPTFPVGPHMTAEIMVTGANFGSGSSREQAPWALADIGLRVILAPSFGEIFFANCFRNGLLPIRLPEATIEQLHDAARNGQCIEVNLIERTVHIDEDDLRIRFDVPADNRESLLNGWNETTRILENHIDHINAFERRQRSEQSWLWQ